MPSYGAQLAQECHTHYPINDDTEPTTIFPEPTTSMLKKRVQFMDADPPTVLPLFLSQLQRHLRVHASKKQRYKS